YRIEYQLAGLDQGLSLARAATTEGAYTRGKFGKIERLGDVVVGARIKTGHAVVQAVARRDNEHGDLVAVLAQLAQYVQAAAARQVQVEQQQVVRLPRERARGLVSVGQPVDRVALVGEELLQRMAQGGVIFDYEDSHVAILTRRQRNRRKPLARYDHFPAAGAAAAGAAAPAPGTPVSAAAPLGCGAVMKPMRDNPERRAAAMTLASVS